MVRLTSSKRDLLFLVLLIVMIKVAVDRKQTPSQNTIIYAPAEQAVEVAYHEPEKFRSEWEDEAREQAQEEEEEDDIAEEMSLALAPDQNEENEMVHKPDEHQMYQLNLLSDQLNQLLAAVDPVGEDATQLKGIQYHLSKMKRKYQHTSPAIALLGPIGSAGIVAKENELEKELLKIAQKVSAILEKRAGIEEENEEERAQTTLQIIEYNKTLLAKLQSKDDSEQS